MSSESVQARKRTLREALRRAFPTGTADCAAAIQTKVLGLHELRGAKSIALYASARHEPPTEHLFTLLRDLEADLAFPCVAGDGLILHGVTRWEELEPGHFGILEPPRDSPEIDPSAIDVFLVPGLLFDREGRRLGRGGGHYDRLLRRSRSDALRIGLCFANHVVGEVPVAEWDVPMQLIVTEDEVIRCPR